MTIRTIAAHAVLFACLGPFGCERAASQKGDLPKHRGAALVVSSSQISRDHSIKVWPYGDTPEPKWREAKPSAGIVEPPFRLRVEW